jgi:glycosyltransferase involved in cell wall biosynthesis
MSSRALKVLLVTHAFPPDSWAGVEVYTLELGRELHRRGHQVVVLARCPPAQGPDAGADYSLSEEQYEGLTVLRMTHRLVLASLGHSYRDERAEAVFRAVLREQSPDVVHFQHLMHFSAGIVGVAREEGIPTALTCHDYWSVCSRVQLVQPDGTRCARNREMGCLNCINGWPRVSAAQRWLPSLNPLVEVTAGLCRWLGKPSVKVRRWLRIHVLRWVQEYRDVRDRQDYVLEMVNQADRIISPSRFLRNVLLETGRLDPERFLYLDYGLRVDANVEAVRDPDPAGRLRFGFVGTLTWHKGGEVLVEAMNLLAGAPAVMNVFGAFEPERDPYHARLAALARSGNVHFRGRVSNNRISEAYREIDVLVVPSIWFENSPITIHEAQIRRTPVLVSGIGGMAELVEDEVTGLHFAVGDPADLARTMRRLIDEPALLQRLQRGRAEVKSMQTNAAELEGVYRELTGKGKRVGLDPSV